MATKSKEELEQEKLRKKREKELKILKAQNEMLEDAKNNILAREEWNDDDDSQTVISEIEAAQKENLQMALSYYQANKNEVESMTYNEVSKKGIDEYERRLKAKNITDEMLHQKELVNATKPSKTTKEGKPKRERKLSNKTTNNVDKTETKKENIEFQKTDKEVIFKARNTQKNDPRCADWDLSNVPDYIQFDIIPLPSKGLCYPKTSPLRSGSIPVAYLTASDENLIHSPNMYRDGKIIDVIIDRKILDKRIKASDLCRGDRDAITVWLRATGYGDNFPIIVRNPQNVEKVYNTNFNLSELGYLDFDLKSDENGLFTYKSQLGNVFKFKQLTKNDEDFLRKQITPTFNNDIKSKVVESISDVKYYFNQITEIEDDVKEELELDIKEIYEWSEIQSDNIDEDEIFNTITEAMILKTVEINGNSSSEYIRGFIENMRAQEAFDYRTFMDNNIPGVDFKINVNIPESDGGGSFETFLRIDDFIFRNV